MSNNAKDTRDAPVALSAWVKGTSRVVDTGAAGGTQVVDIKINRGVPSWLVADYKTHYAYSMDAQQFGGMFFDGAISFTFDRRDVSRDMDIGE